MKDSPERTSNMSEEIRRAARDVPATAAVPGQPDRTPVFGRMETPVFTIASPAQIAVPASPADHAPQGTGGEILISRPISDEALFLAAQARRLCREPGNSLMLIGLGQGHGSSEITTQIALAMASINLVNRLLVIDANAESPLDEYFGVRREPGLMDTVAEDGSVFKHLCRLPAGLSVLPIGNAQRESVNQLIAKRGIELFEKLTHCHTLSLVNGPAFGTGPDMLLASRVTYVAVVAARGKVSAAEMHRAKKSIESVGSKFAGVILSRGH
jgi:Mrp family chromosome partitioning ATPase